MANHSSILAWRIPRIEPPEATVYGVAKKKVGQDLVTKQQHIVRWGGVLLTADLKVKESAGNLDPSVSSVMSDSL